MWGLRPPPPAYWMITIGGGSSQRLCPPPFCVTFAGGGGRSLWIGSGMWHLVRRQPSWFGVCSSRWCKFCPAVSEFCSDMKSMSLVFVPRGNIFNHLKREWWFGTRKLPIELPPCGGQDGSWTSGPLGWETNSTLRSHRLHDVWRDVKNWKIWLLLLLFLHSVCIYTVLDNSCFRLLYCVTQMLRYVRCYVTQPVWTRC